jgi:arylsulfatase
MSDFVYEKAGEFRGTSASNRERDMINDICSLQDFIPTFAATAGEPPLVEKVKAGYRIGDTTFKVHLDGVNLQPFLSGKE